MNGQVRSKWCDIMSRIRFLVVFIHLKSPGEVTRTTRHVELKMRRTSSVLSVTVKFKGVHVHVQCTCQCGRMVEPPHSCSISGNCAEMMQWYSCHFPSGLPLGELIYSQASCCSTVLFPRYAPFLHHLYHKWKLSR